jgi:G3E family GTPase
MNEARIPVTILTGYLGSGKTTLLNRILKEQHGQRIAVIENEFGEVGIDNEILIDDRDEQVVVMNNGCICCTVRGDLVRILGDLSKRRRLGELGFDRVVIETTGLADPAPVAQTFFVEDAVHRDYLLDAIITLVDAKHGGMQLDAHHEAQEHVGFADRILISKTDLVQDVEVQNLSQRLTRLNPRAPQRHVNFGAADIGDILDIQGFKLDAILRIEPEFLADVSHEHDDEITSFVFRDSRPFDLHKLETFFGLLIETYGQDMLRYKGVQNIQDNPRRLLFQGVHMIMGADEGKPWNLGEARESKMVFIGRNLPRSLIEQGLALCVPDDAQEPTTG